MATATFSGTYTQNGGEDYAAGTVAITPFGGATVTATLDAAGHYSETITLVLTSVSGVWVNDAGAIVTSPPSEGVQVIPPGGTVDRGKCRIVETITGAPVATSVREVAAGATVNTGRDVGTVLGGSGGAGGGVASVDGQTGAVDLSGIYVPVAGFTEMAQDAVGAALTDTATLDLTYNDGAGTVSGAVLDSPKVNGVAITGTPTAGQVPTATGGTAATWQTPAAGGGSAATTAALGTVKLQSPPRDGESPVMEVRRLTADRWVPRRRVTSNFTGDTAEAVTGVASTGIFTCATHGYKVGDLVVFALTTGGSGLTAGLPYFVVSTNLAAGTFSVALAPGGAVLTFATDLTAGTVERKRDGYLFDFTNMLYTTSAGRPAIRAADGGSGTAASMFSKVSDYRDWDVRVRFRPANDATTSSTDYGPGVFGCYEDSTNNWGVTHYFAAAQGTIHCVVNNTDVTAAITSGVPTSPLSTSQDMAIRMQKRGDLIRYKIWATNVAEPNWQLERRIRHVANAPSTNTTTDNPERGAFGLSQIFCGAYFLDFSVTELVRESENLLHNSDLTLPDTAGTADSPRAVTGVASTGVFTSATHGYSVGDLVVFGGLPVRTQGYGITPLRSYYVAAVPNANTFTVATTRGGAAITFTTDFTSGYVIRNPVPAFWGKTGGALLGSNRLEVQHVAGPDGTIRPALALECTTPNDPNLSWFQYLWNPLNCPGDGAFHQRLQPHPQSIPARRVEFSCWASGAVSAIQALGLGMTMDVYMYDAYTIAMVAERQTYHPGLSPTTSREDASADPASYDGAQTVSTFGWTFLKSIIEIPQHSSLHQMRCQILFHEATDTGNVLVMDPCLRPVG